MKTCKNCKHLFISGMFQSWGGTAGYCLLIQFDENNIQYTESGTRKTNPKAIVQIYHTCKKFERKTSKVKIKSIQHPPEIMKKVDTEAEFRWNNGGKEIYEKLQTIPDFEHTEEFKNYTLKFNL